MDDVATVFFDLDGTLVDSAPGIIASMRDVLVEYRLRPSDDDLRQVIGPPLDASFGSWAYRSHSLTRPCSGTARSTARGDLRMFSLYPGVMDLVTTLLGSGATLAVATAKREDFARRAVRLVGLREAFVERRGRICSPGPVSISQSFSPTPCAAGHRRQRRCG
jgi:phosphoglycolate phosphatase